MADGRPPPASPEVIAFYARMSDIVMLAAFILPIVSVGIYYVSVLMGQYSDGSSSSGNKLSEDETRKRDIEEEEAIKSAATAV